MSDEVQATAIDLDETEWKSVRRGMHIVPLGLVFESPENARYLFDSKKIDDLAEMIKSCGGINNDAGKARRNETLGEFDGFELLDGARRYRALQKLGATHMKLEIVEVFDGKATRQVAMMTRLGKVDLNPMELCREYHRMMDAADYASVKELAAQTGQSGHERTIHDIMSLDKLQPDVAEELELGDLTLAHAVLIAREKPDDQIKLLGMCYETETVTIGSLPETHKRLISAKALASIIQSQFREAPSEKKADLLDSKKEDAKQREKATSLETSGTKLLEGAGSDEDDEDQDDGDDVDENQTGTSQSPDEHAPVTTFNDAKPAEKYEPVDAVSDICLFLSSNFKGEWVGAMHWSDFAKKLLNELIVLRSGSHGEKPALKSDIEVINRQTTAEILSDCVLTACHAAEGAPARWNAILGSEMNDEDLQALIADELGIEGGTTIDVYGEKYALRWIGGKKKPEIKVYFGHAPLTSMSKDREFAKIYGSELLRMAREIFEIQDAPAKKKSKSTVAFKSKAKPKAASKTAKKKAVTKLKSKPSHFN